MGRTLRDFVITVIFYWPLVTAILWLVGMFFVGETYPLIPPSRETDMVYMGDFTRLAIIVATVICVCADPVDVRGNLKRRLK